MKIMKKKIPSCNTEELWSQQKKINSMDSEKKKG